MRPSPLLATSCSQWAQRSTIGSGKTSTSPWQSSRPLRGEPRRGLHSTYPPLKRDALCRVSSVVSFVVPSWGPPHLYATRVAAPRASAVLPSHPRPRQSWDPHSPARSARRPHVALRSRAMLFVSSHYGHARGTLYFFPVGCLCYPCYSVYQRPGLSPPPPPPQRLAATGHPLLSRHTLPCQTAQRRPRTPPLPPPTPVEVAPFVGGRSPCF